MKSSRTNITLSSPVTMAMILADGNPGALTMLLTYAGSTDPMDAMMTMLHMDDLNMRGDQIWSAFKFADRSTEKMVELMQKRDPEMIEAVNRECAHGPGERVFSGASFKRR